MGEVPLYRDISPVLESRSVVVFLHSEHREQKSCGPRFLESRKRTKVAHVISNYRLTSLKETPPRRTVQ